MSRIQTGERASGQRVRSARSVPRRDIQNLVTIACVSLGSWAFAFAYFFLITGPNHYVFGGMTAVMALTWSVIFALRLRTRLRQG